MKKVTIYTDGACSGNPGPGGWGAILQYGDVEKEISGYDPVTTNNKMEMMAAIQGLESLKESCVVELYSDSQYVIKGITEWLPGWKARGWKTASKTPVKNLELWQRLERTLSKHEITWHWVRGHNGHTMNERVDQLATGAIKK